MHLILLETWRYIHQCHLRTISSPECDFLHLKDNIHGLVKDCGNSRALALELPYRSYRSLSLSRGYFHAERRAVGQITKKTFFDLPQEFLGWQFGRLPGSVSPYGGEDYCRYCQPWWAAHGLPSTTPSPNSHSTGKHKAQIQYRTIDMRLVLYEWESD